jgi:hypothetical protein
MIMKNINYLLYLSFFTLMLNAASAQNKPIWNATIKVIDEAGQPITGADAEMWWYVNASDGTTTYDKTEGLTDTNGMFKTSHEANGSIDLGFQASKAEYYSSKKGYEIAPLSDSDPTKWNHDVTLMIKKIGKPIPMYAKQIDSITFPEFNKAIGYDLMVGDWVGPYGKGINSDILFTENHPDEKSGYTFTVSFPRSEDGIQGLTRDWNFGVSGLLSSHEAPLDGYQPKYVQAQMPNPNRIYYFRVRTKVDDLGNIVSAHYGKIYGDFMQFTYYLNPTPNDRNVEFDPKQNLLQGLHSFEQVKAP